MKIPQPKYKKGQTVFVADAEGDSAFYCYPMKISDVVWVDGWRYSDFNEDIPERMCSDTLEGFAGIVKREMKILKETK